MIKFYSGFDVPIIKTFFLNLLKYCLISNSSNNNVHIFFSGKLTILNYFVYLSTKCNFHMMNQIFAQRLKSARVMAGMSLQKLADKLEGTAVSRQALHKYEKGVALPGSPVLIALSKALNVKTDYFFKSIQVNLEQVEFRKKSRLGLRAESQIKERIKDKISRYIEIEEIIGKTHKFENPFSDPLIDSTETAENYATELRKSWSLGLNPIPNILEMLEDKNIKVIEMDAPPAFDGLSAWSGKIPVIVLNRNLDEVRKRFTAIHELGHLIFTFPEAGKATEKLCHYFAAAFLIPAARMKEELGEKRTRITATELVSIKEYWGISIQAIMRRANDLGIITGSHYKRFCIWISKNKLRNEDGLGKYQGQEKALRFEQLVAHAHAEELITISKAAELLDVSMDEIRHQSQMA